MRPDRENGAGDGGRAGSTQQAAARDVACSELGIKTVYGGKWDSGTRSSYSPTANCPLHHYRIFGLLEAAQKLVLVAESFHHQRCVLKVKAFLHTWAGGER